MKQFFLSTAMLVLLGCSQPPSGADGENASSPAMSENAVDLSGHYRITALGDGTALPYAIEVSASDEAIWWEPRCAGQGLSYRGAQDGIEFYDPLASSGPQIVCDIGFVEQLPLLWDELEGVRNVTIASDRSVRITGDGREWVFEPTTDPLPDDLSGRWQLQELNGRGGLEMQANEFVADETRLSWEPQCADRAVTYEMDGGQFRVTEPAYTPPGPPGPGAQPTEVPRVVCAIGVPDEVDASLNVMRMANAVSRDNQNNIVLSGTQGYVVLKRLAK